MTAPDVPDIWASAAGVDVATGLTATAAEWQSNYTSGSVTFGYIQFSFSGAPDLSSVMVAHILQTSGFANAANNGSFYIVDKDNTAKTITIRTTGRTDDSLDETGASASAEVDNSGAQVSAPSAAKQAQGYVAGEKPNAAHFNWLFNKITTYILFLSNGGANVFRATVAAWEAISTRTAEGLEWITGIGGFRFDPTATDLAGEGVLDDAAASGRGFYEAAHPDAIFALLANDLAEALLPVVANLDFASISAGAVGSQTVTVDGASAGDTVKLGPPAGINAGLVWCGHVSADDTVTIRLHNTTGGAIDPAAADWTVTVEKPNTMPVQTVRTNKIFLNLLAGAYTSGTLETDLGIAANEAAFYLLCESTRRRRLILADAAAKAVVQGSATADAIMTIYEGAGY